MKKILIGMAVVLVAGLLSGCTKVEEGKYVEGTYFGADPENKHTAVVYVDESGMIKSVFVDAAYNKMDDEGNSIATTKQILGDEYGMKTVSSIDAEWYEQVQKVADKVVQEQGIAWLEFKYRVTDENDEYSFTDEMPEGSTADDKKYTDSVSGVTIHVNETYTAIKDALDKAKK